jgi:hypothetical protein
LPTVEAIVADVKEKQAFYAQTADWEPPQYFIFFYAHYAFYKQLLIKQLAF